MTDIKELRGCIGVLTIRDDEHEAVRSRLTNVSLAIGRRHYQCGTVKAATNDDVIVCLYRIPEQGNGPAQHAAQDMIADLDPRLVALVGIAGGVPDSEVTLGDVILAVRLADMRVKSERADAPQQFELRGEPVHRGLTDLIANLPESEVQGWATPESLGAVRPSAPLDDRLFDGPPAWSAKLRSGLQTLFHGPCKRTWPIRHLGTVASSDSLVRDPALAAHWLEFSRKVQAIEMEAAGVFEAANSSDVIYPVLVVRGLSDIIGYKREPGWTNYACQSAAAFAIALIRSGYLARISPLRMHAPAVPPVRVDRPLDHRLPISVGLLLLTRRLEPVGGHEAISLWLKEILHQPPGRIAFEYEGEFELSVAKLDSRQDLSLEERKLRMRTIHELEWFKSARQVITRLVQIILGGHFREWGLLDRHQYASFIARTLKVFDSNGAEPEPEDYRICHVQTNRALFANCTVLLNQAERQELWRRARELWPGDTMPHHAILEGRWHPARSIPVSLRLERMLPQMAYKWLIGETVDLQKNDNDLIAEARTAFAIEEATFMVERKR